MTRLEGLITVFLATVCLATAQDRGTPAPAPTRAPAGPDRVDLTFGVYTSDKATTMYRMFAPVLEHLQDLTERELKRPVGFELRIYKTYDEALEAFVRSEVDLVRFGPASYVLASARNPGIQLVAIELDEGKKTFQGMVIVAKDSPIRTLADLRGRSFAFGDRNSTIGRYLIQDLLLAAGVTDHDLRSRGYLGSHDKVFRAVELGDYDAGAVKEGTFRKLNVDGQVRVIAAFPNVTKPWLARAGLDPAYVAALRQALLKITDKEVLKSLEADAFAPTSEADFTETRAAMKRAEAFTSPPAAPKK